MSKMFKCSDGTMFPINDVLSVKEVTDYYNYRGEKVYPRVYTDEQEMKEELGRYYAKRLYFFEDVRDVRRSYYDETIYGKFFRHLFVRLRHGDVRKSDQEQKKKEQLAYEKDLRERDRALKQRQKDIESCTKCAEIKAQVEDVGYGYITIKLWNVKIRGMRKIITITHMDYKRLCEVMGK